MFKLNWKFFALLALLDPFGQVFKLWGDTHSLPEARLSSIVEGRRKMVFDQMCGDRGDGSKDFLSYWDKGLPKGPIRNSKVLVVGAGISGLTAAKLLADAGHEVKILEASNRVGGNIQTYRSFEEGWSGDLGAMRIPQTHQFTRKLISHFGLKLAPFSPAKAQNHFFMRGKTYNATVFENTQSRMEIYNDYSIPKNESGKSPMQFWEESLREPLRDLQSMSWIQFVDKYDKYSMEDYLVKQGISRPMVNLMGVVVGYETVLPNNFAEMIMQDCLFRQDMDIVEGGMDNLPRAFMPHVGALVQYNSRVTRIEQSNKGVTVKADCKGVDCPDSETKVFEADYVIQTTTAPATLSVDYQPMLSQNKSSAVRNTFYVVTSKVFLAFRSSFWEAEAKAERPVVRVITDMALQNLYYPSVKMTGRKGVILASYAWGGNSRRMQGMTDEDIIEESLRSVAKIHGVDYAYVRAQFVGGVVKNWGQDRFSRGSHALAYPFHFQHIQDDLAKPEGRVYFAGEHTEFPHAWMEASIKSGIRAAAEVHLQRDYTQHRGYIYS